IIARQRVRQNQALYEVTNSMLCLRAPEQIAQTAADYLGHAFGGGVAICLGDPRVARWFFYVGAMPEEQDTDAARAAFDSCCETGAPTRLFDHAEGLYLPLATAQRHSIGVVHLSDGSATDFDEELNMVFVRLMVSQIAIALEYRRLEREQQQAAIEAETEKMRGNLLRAISHDLRTPLTGIYGSSSVMLEQGSLLGEEKCKQFLLDIRETAQWLIRMVENLLSVTRIGQGASNRLVKAPEAAEEIIGAAIANLRKSYPTAKIKVQAPEQLLMVPMDGTLIQQVLINLTENAIKYAGSPEPIEVSLQQCGGMAVFTVTDHGRGIPADRIGSAFEGKPVSNADRGDSYRGMGIGLPICKTIINAHGGVISALNLKEGGCRFSFTLPL
ncbi:MAG: ATP-binding protein, partial [Oscillospiraceae bacterium]